MADPTTRELLGRIERLQAEVERLKQHRQRRHAAQLVGERVPIASAGWPRAACCASPYDVTAVAPNYQPLVRASSWSAVP